MLTIKNLRELAKVNSDKDLTKFLRKCANDIEQKMPNLEPEERLIQVYLKKEKSLLDLKKEANLKVSGTLRLFLKNNIVEDLEDSKISEYLKDHLEEIDTMSFPDFLKQTNKYPWRYQVSLTQLENYYSIQHGNV